MAEAKTKLTAISVDSFLEKTDDNTRKDCYTIMGIMGKVTGEKPKMWGPAIIGFGEHHYKYDSGREGDICLIGFSPRKADITLYILCGFDEQNDLLAKIGKHKASGGCLHVKKLTDVDLNVLEDLIAKAAAFKKKNIGMA
jgi:hypothetical protein